VHAYDNRLLDGDIVVRFANPGESLTLLNGQVLSLEPDLLLVCDETKPLGLAGIIFQVGKFAVRSWSDPVRKFRAEIGLPPGRDPIFEGQHSPDLVLAMFSELLGKPQPDWPPHTRVTGFAFYDRLDEAAGLAPELARFLEAGPAPIVFTLGSSAVMDAGDFYQQSAAAAGD
jgi:hypothetical protein